MALAALREVAAVRRSLAVTASTPIDRLDSDYG